jgi:hypothetical protein
MFFFVLALGTIQLLVGAGAFALARRGTAGWGAAWLIGLAGLFVSFCVLMSPALFFQAASLLVLGLACVTLKVRPATFMACSVGVTALLVLVLGIIGRPFDARLRDEYPIESLSGRLAYEAPRPAVGTRSAQSASDSNGFAPQPLSDKTLLRLADLESDLEAGSDHSPYHSSVRSEALRRLHASQVEQFIESQGFGIGRGVRPSARHVPIEEPPVIPLPAADELPAGDPSADPSAQPRVEPLPLAERPAAERMHRSGVVDFADPGGFGYVRDRDHVAGFQAHAFRALPELVSTGATTADWVTRRVELLSLLKHDEPGVYISENLPRMAELADAPIRPLDSFEGRALASLREGEDLIAETAGSRIRMLGSIRAARQCIQCHAVDRGTLLGAFSYELIRAGAPTGPSTTPAKTGAQPEML